MLVSSGGMTPVSPQVGAMTLRLRSVARQAEKWSGEQRGASSGTKPERNDRCRAADGGQSDCIMLRLATSALGAERRGVVERVRGQTESPGSEAESALVARRMEQRARYIVHLDFVLVECAMF